MLINSFKIYDKSKTFCKFENMNGNDFFFSTKNNTEGKTTVVRSIIFGLGFYTNKITDSVSNSLVVEVNVDTGNESIPTVQLERHFKTWTKISVNGVVYDLTEANDQQVFSGIFKFDNYEQFNDSLATFYIDQEFGWHTLNIGKIHPDASLNFNFGNLFFKLTSKSESLRENEKIKDELTSKIKAIKSLLSLWSNNNKSLPLNEKLEFRSLSRDISELKSEEYILKNKIAKCVVRSRDFLDILRIIDSNPTLSSLFTEERKKIIKQMGSFERKMEDYERQALEQRLLHVKTKISEIENKMSSKFSDSYGTDFSALEQVASLTKAITKDDIGKLKYQVDLLEERKNIVTKKINSDKMDLLKLVQKNFDDFSDLVEYFTETESNLTIKQLFSTKSIVKVATLSGAKKSIMILLIRMFIRSLLRNEKKIAFPLIIDTLNSNDPSLKTMNNYLSIIEQMVHNGEQVIIIGISGSDASKEIIKKLRLTEKSLDIDFDKVVSEPNLLDLLKDY